MLKKGDYKWHAVYVKSRAEKRSFEDIVSIGIDAYLPLKISKKKWSDRIKVVEEPLIRGYLFVKVSNREYGKVLQAPGVVAYVSFGGKRAEIPEKQIQDLRVFLEELNDAVQVTNENLTKGEKVKVLSGPLEGMEGEISEIKGRKRIGMRFESLGCSVFADVPIELVEKVESIK